MKKYITLALLAFVFIKAEAQPSEKVITISIPGGTVEGTLLSPSSNPKEKKLAIIIAGSGPTDRNGNNPLGVSAGSYKMLAESLASENIATFRYDKRGIAKSAVKGFSEANLSFDDYVNDALKVYDHMRDSLGYKNIYFIGHSEGSLIGMIASQKRPVKGYVSVSGAGRNIDVVITEQLTNQHQPAAIINEVTADLSSLKKGKLIDSVPQYMYALFRPSVQPYMISWLKHDPTEEIKKVNCPILILQGTCDIQVLVRDAKNLYAANPKSKLDTIPSMTHTLKNAESGCFDKDQKTYHDATLPLNTQFVKDIVSFINN